MKIAEIIRSSYIALTVNKIRTFLTMLGVIIGVFAVVSLVALVKGFQNYITDQFNSLGSNLLYVMPGIVAPGKPDFTSNTLEQKHIDLLKRTSADLFTSISPFIQASKSISYKTRSCAVTVLAGNDSMIDILNVPMDRGRFYTKNDVESKARVIVLGKFAVDQLFSSKNPVGEKVKIDGTSFTVIGTVKEWGPNFDDGVYMPNTTLSATLGVSRLTAINIKIKDGVDMEIAAEQIKLALRRELKADAYTVRSQKDILNTVNDILGVLSIALAAIAGISLFVGGIGIMNIMLVSVTERTREIGLRKALGATSRDIMLQFMTEAVVISFLGGTIGLVLAWIATLAISSLLRAEITLWSVLLGFGFSLLIGVAFGTYPAVSASKKDPIEALRYE